MADRKTSPLASEDMDPWSEPSSVRMGRDQRKQSESVPRQRRFPVASKRKQGGEQLDPFALKSFNVNIPVVLRRLARIVAARHEIAVQEVVADALAEKFERDGVEVPTTLEEYNRLVRDGKL